MNIPRNSGLHPEQSDRGDVLGLLLAQQRSSPGQGRTGRHHGPHHDHPHQLRQRRSAKDLLYEVHRHLSLRLFLHGVRSSDRVRLCGLHRQEDPATQEQVPGHAEIAPTVKEEQILWGEDPCSPPSSSSGTRASPEPAPPPGLL